ncbi:MAG: transglycosylase domain-containing protein [Clostridia bacterium]|nr:transglycosylase domain-containing protein [Clostridia bacterium]
MAENKSNDTMAFEHTKTSRIPASSGDTVQFDSAAPAKSKKKRKGSDAQPLFVPRTRPRSTVLAVLFSVIKTIVLLGFVAIFAGIGAFLGIAKAYVDTTPALDVSALTKSDRTSYIYDCNGNMITTFAGMEFRDWADISEIPDKLKNALIAVEDVRFYKHSGLDFKRLFSAVVNAVRNTKTHGGSTITQQLIKIKILSNIQSYKRKIQEAYLAFELENTVSKDKILEAYMNDVYLGDSNYGFKTAALDYFGKELQDLTIRECAMLAGMVQKPNVTNPRANTYRRFHEDGTNKMDVTNARTDTVLQAMFDNNFISRDEYEQALNEEVYIKEISEQKQLYDMAYFVEYGIYDVITHMLEQRELTDTTANRTAIEKELRTGGYHIYLTVDPQIQTSVQDTITDWDKYPALRNTSANEITDPNSGITAAQPQAAAVIMDQHTGNIVAMIGGREEPIQKRQLNRAYQSSMPVGSAIKPLSVFGPALELGIEPGSSILNAEIPIDGYGGEKGYPSIGSARYEGLISMRRGVASSLNIVAARVLFDYVTVERSAKYLEQLGVEYSRINKDGPGLALGTSGITPLEMCAAYATIANGGMYYEPLSFTYVVAEDGSVVLDADKVREKHRVFSETTSFMLTDMLKDVINYGTGTSAKIPGMTVAGKTGTNDDYTSVYFAGYTGHYTASLWVGHDKYSEKLASGSTGGNSAAPLWQAFMQKIHQGLPDVPIMDVSPAELGLVRVAICPISGKLATDECMHDTHNPPLTDWCAVDNMPTEYCDMHCLVDYCSASNTYACSECASTTRYQKCVVLIRSDSVYALLDNDKLMAYIPNAIITDLDPAEFMRTAISGPSACPIHGGSGGANLPIDTLITQAKELMQTVRNYLDAVQTLGALERALLEGNIIQVKEALASNDAQRIYRCYSELKRNYLIYSAQHPPVIVPTASPGITEPPVTPDPDDPAPTPSPSPTPAP